jgi:hypothetical protein
MNQVEFMYIFQKQIAFIHQVNYTSHLENEVILTMEWPHMNNEYGNHAHLSTFWSNKVRGTLNDLIEGVTIQCTKMQSFLFMHELN